MTLPLWATFMANAAWEMQPETTLEDQRNEVAELIEDQPKMAKIMELTMKDYARECCKASLEKAAGDVTLNGPIEYESSQEIWDIITNPENIVLC